MPDQQDLLLVKAARQGGGQIEDVVDELRHAQSRTVTTRGERLARAPLVPVDDGEGRLQRPGVATHQRELRRPRAAVHEQRHGIRHVLGANQHPSLRFADRDRFEHGETVRMASVIEAWGERWNDAPCQRHHHDDREDDQGVIPLQAPSLPGVTVRSRTGREDRAPREAPI
jgi:hypothetical protein